MVWSIMGVVGFVLVVGLFTGAIRIGRRRRLPPPPVVDWTPQSVPSEWGTVVDPDGDCRPTWRDGGFSLAVPGGIHELQGDGKRNAPRAMRTVRGDFAMEVDLAGGWNPRSGGSFPFAPFHGAGILIWVADADFDFVRFERARIKTPLGGGFAYVHLEGHAARFPHPLGSFKIRDSEFPSLRVERHGERLFAMMRIGLEDWRQVGAATSTRDEIEVGVAAVSNTDEPFEVRFTRVQFYRPS
jgi:hypothetical protein